MRFSSTSCWSCTNTATRLAALAGQSLALLRTLSSWSEKIGIGLEITNVLTDIYLLGDDSRSASSVSQDTFSDGHFHSVYTKESYEITQDMLILSSIPVSQVIPKYAVSYPNHERRFSLRQKGERTANAMLYNAFLFQLAELVAYFKARME